ncbi:putative Cell pattern formation-associated protein stuA [Glarea lozoyensis 74030]|uniref:Putative Cell pattern formation-associated protein stuA n=1 Tax=Glarea lozoyensis (strain ATCC 74030 / MF5533) TaxID=1104152 RepID=H0EMM2_GLAL7|nr:putative Cell pattern formation-associated protein stuA [Glarea lozoyensis 74030]
MAAVQPGMPGQGGYGGQQGFDTTGQIAPPGMKPRVTATLWEDEGSLCFQVEAKGVCVARREAGMTRGRRDGILKSEKMRHVVKIGPMHLKGVWIPFERALDFANKEKITELLYPLVMGNMGSSDGNFQWGQPQGGMPNAQGSNPLSIDTGLSNARSMPTTPATTPPGSSIQSMQQYQQPPQQPYDASRQMYSAPPAQQSVYAQPPNGQQNMPRYSQPNSYIKSEMGPPLARAGEPEHHESKDANGMIHHPQTQQQVGHSQGEEEADHEHDAEYTHDNSSNYDANRASYNYNQNPAVGSLPSEHPHLSPEMTGSPNHPASGRATPRTASAPQPYYQQQGGYSTPPPPASNKRGRDDEDDGRPSSRGPGAEGELKRRKTLREDSVSGPAYGDAAPLNRARSVITQRRR